MEKFKKIFILAGIGVVVILGGLLVLKGFSLPKQGETLKEPVNTPAPTPTPLPLAPGKQVYSIRSDSSSPGPGISEATFDPLDVNVGEPMVISVKAKDASSVTITMINDAGTADHSLTSSSSGIWTATIASQATHNRIYGATIVAKNTRGEERKVELWFR